MNRIKDHLFGSGSDLRQSESNKSLREEAAGAGAAIGGTKDEKGFLAIPGKKEC